MARARFVKPEFFKHGDLFDAEKASGLPLRLAFAGLWTQCDRAGRFAWKPRELKLDVLPYDDVEFSDVLDALESHGFIRSYVVDGKRYGVVPSFGDHQPFHKNEPQSKLPTPPDIVAPAPVIDRAEPAIGRRKPAIGRPSRSTTVTVTDTTTEGALPPDGGLQPAIDTNGRHPPPPDTPAVDPPQREEEAPRDNWPARISAVLASRGIKASPGKVGGMLDVAVREFTAPRVIRALEGFLDKGVTLWQQKPEFVTLEQFAKNPGVWVEKITPLNHRPKAERESALRAAAS